MSLSSMLNRWDSIWAIVFIFLTVSCSNGDHADSLIKREVLVSDGHYADFVDFFYDFSKKHRLTTLWFGWYKSEKPSDWFERPEDSNFKIKAELLSEDIGYIFAANHFEHGKMTIAIYCGTNTKAWLHVIEDFYTQVERHEWFSFVEGGEYTCEILDS